MRVIEHIIMKERPYNINNRTTFFVECERTIIDFYYIYMQQNNHAALKKNASSVSYKLK